MNARARVTRAHQHLFFFRLHPFTEFRISFTHNPIRVKTFPSKRFTFGTELHRRCSVCSEKEILHKTMENTKVNETVKEKDKSLHP